MYKHVYVQSFPSGTSGKEPSVNAGDIRDVGLILGWEDPLEEGMATHSGILAWTIHGQRNLVDYSLQGRKESDTSEST